MRLVLALACFALAASPAMAATWEYVTKDAYGSGYYLDTSSIRSDSTGNTKNKLVWIKSQLTKNYPTNNGVIVTSLEEYDCMGRFREVKKTTKFADGTIQESDPHDWIYIPPDTVQEDIQAYVCK